MVTRKNHKSKNSKKKFRKTRSKRQRGGADEQELEHQRDDDIIRLSSFNDEDVRIVIGDLLREGVSHVAKNTALRIASKEGHVELVEMLLNNGANVNAKNSYGVTALHIASREGHTDIVAMLLEKGADVNAKTNWGDTALMAASWKGHKEIVKLLKQYIVAQTFPRHLERQQNRLQVGRVMDSKKMPGDLTHKIITEHFGGKRKTRKSKKSKRKTRKTRRK